MSSVLTIKFPNDFDKRMAEYRQKFLGDSPRSIDLDNIDYSDSALRKAWEKKWDVMQVIWEHYNTGFDPENVFVPISALVFAVKGRTVEVVDGILAGFQKQGYFGKWHRGTKNYSIEGMEFPKFLEAYHSVEVIYENFAKKYQEQTQKLNQEQKGQNDGSGNKPVGVVYKIESVAGKLTACDDGMIRYGSEVVGLRNQIKDLCRLFMKNHQRLVTIDDIKDAIIHADKRRNTSHDTIAKYVSELRGSLKTHFKKDVIFNQKEEGWYFDINRK